MIPYSAEAYFAFLEQYNRAIWPTQIFATVSALAALWLASRPSRPNGSIAVAILVVGWGWNGIGYYLVYLWTIDFVAPAFALLMTMQASFLGAVTIRGNLVFRSRPGAFRRVAMVIAGVALLYDPVIAVFSEHGWATARVVGLVPGPTVLFTLAVLAMCERVSPYLLVIPILWSGSAVVLACFLGIVPDLVLPLTGIAIAASILWRQFRANPE